MTSGVWEIRENGNRFVARLRSGWLSLRFRGGVWHMHFAPDVVDQTERLAATNARDAQIEALEFVRGWATELLAQAAELRGTMEGTDA